ncbi:MAG: acetaldehyde dehydrogenase (acetylating), partial [Oscillospiraceae bacterium]
MNEKIKVAIVGPGNIGVDLMEKIRKRAKNLEVGLMVGIYDTSVGIQRAKEYGIPVQIGGIEPLLENDDIKIVFEATSAAQHIKNAPLYKQYGKKVFDLTPAAVGPYVVPSGNLNEHIDADNINLVTCGGQATTPIVAAISQVQKVKYAEIVSTLASKSAGPGTRANIDEFTETTATALRVVGKAEKSKAIIILNPAEPPLMMRNTIYCQTDGEPDMQAITNSVNEMVKKMQVFVPGYRLALPPTKNGETVVTMVQV